MRGCSECILCVLDGLRDGVFIGFLGHLMFFPQSKKKKKHVFLLNDSEIVRIIIAVVMIHVWPDRQ